MAFRFFRASKVSPPGIHDYVTLDDVGYAYRLVLKREPDPAGLAHYASLVRDGLRLEELIQTLMASSERQARLESPALPHAPVPGSIKTTQKAPRVGIQPEDVISAFTVDELIATADDYYRRIDDPAPLMRKPFAFLQEAPAMLENLGAVIQGLRLGKTMTVLDFGAGTGWLSRILTELHCQAICCDPSEAALDIGRRMFEQYPPMSGDAIPPMFLRFDGHRIDLPDASVDRIISFDAFHHIPNQRVVLQEFERVLRPGGSVGFSEPGLDHSQSPQSQYEMRNHRVLENDIDIVAIETLARAVGFSEMSLRVTSDLSITFDEYVRGFRESQAPDVRDKVWRNVAEIQANRSIFFLRKGVPALDSRGHEGLSHRIEVAGPPAVSRRDRSAEIPFRITNTGSATWLSTNVQIYGVVRLGSHLYDALGNLVNVDHSRHGLPHDIAPGECFNMVVTVDLPLDEDCTLVFDLVAEGVRWFEHEGSSPVPVAVSVSA